jgi:uncharacterized protein (TIGR00288 family)
VWASAPSAAFGNRSQPSDSTPLSSPTAADEERIALFLDYENLAIGARDKLGGLKFDMKPLAEALAERGRVVVRKAYADWSMFSEDRRMLTRNHVELIEIPQRMGMVRKNSADIKMAVDAMELCFERDYLTTFVICTGDSDFTPLVHKLRELNKRVIGVGVKASTSALLPPACDEFIFYEMLDGVEIPRAAARAERAEGAERADRTDRGASSRGRRPGAARPMPEPEPVQDAAEEAPLPELEASGSLEALTALVTQTLAGLQRNSGDAVRGSALKRALIRKDPTFSEANFGFRSLGEMLRFLAERNAVEITESAARGDPEVGFPEQGGGEVEMFAALRALVVAQAQKGPPLMSGLKHQLKKRAPGFDERKLGYSGFLQFCKATHTRGFVDLSWSDDADDYVLRAAEPQGR